jgi:mannose-1-phosphate guanylyltransferase
MKAFLLAAGLGTRLRPITDSAPKCLLPIGGRPMLDIWLDALAKAGVNEVLVNAHHLAGQVEAHVAARSGAPAVHVVIEPALLGSAGTLRANRDFVIGEDMFLAINADNLTDFDLSVLIDAHRAAGAVATLSLFKAPDPTQVGVVEVNAGRIVGFEEKPTHPRGDLANAGMYAFAPAVIDEIAGPDPRDIGFHLLPKLVGRAHAVALNGSYFIDIGTSEALRRARDDWEGRTQP